MQQGEERQRSWELRDSELVGCEPGTSAPDGPTHEEGLLAPRLLQRSPFKGSQPNVGPSEVSPAPLPACSGLDCCLCGALHWHSVMGRSFPRSLVHSLCPGSLLPACVLHSLVNLWWPIWGTWISPLTIYADSAKKQPPDVHRLCGGCMDCSQRECKARAVWVILRTRQSSPHTADPHPFSRQA